MSKNNYLCGHNLYYMLRIRWVSLSLMFLTSVSAAWSQAFRHDYEGSGSWYIGLNAGNSLSMNENVHYSDLFTTKVPSASVILGRTFTPRWSLQFEGGISPQRGHAPEVAIKYKPQLYTPYDFYCAIVEGDVKLNLLNCFRAYDSRNWFDFNLVCGCGELFKFGMSEKVRQWQVDVYPVDAENYWFWTAKVGLEGAWHIRRSADLIADMNIYATDNAYNGVRGSNRFCDWFFTMRVGVLYYLTNLQHRHRFANQKRPHLFWQELD